MGYLVLMVLCFLFFVFVSECINPFVKPSLHQKRRRWRLGRQLALSLLVIGILVLVSAQLNIAPLSFRLPVLLIVSLILVFLPIWKYRR